MESPGSPLSSLASDEFGEDVRRSPHDDVDEDETDDAETMRSAKRQRLSAEEDSIGGGEVDEEEEEEEEDIPVADDIHTEISSDTSGSVPGSPSLPPQGDDADVSSAENQVTICRWKDCSAGDLGNLDSLVGHIHTDHVPPAPTSVPGGNTANNPNRRRWACEWGDCSRKGMPHASGYALKAHMRSHTREKPFYCALPECDRAFTRSDALVKHMRSVHETEMVGRSGGGAPPRQRLKLVLSSRPDESGLSTGIGGGLWYPAELGLTEEEKDLPPSELFRLLRRQMRWTEEEHGELQQGVRELEREYQRGWTAKELLVENVMEAEYARHSGSESQGVERFKVKPRTDLPLRGQAWFRS